MKLYILCLLVSITWVSGAPAPRPDGPFESIFHMFAGIPQGMVSGAKQMLGGIPFINTIPRVMQGGLNIGNDIAENMDYMMGGGGRGRSGDSASRRNRNHPEESDGSHKHSHRSDRRQAPKGPLESIYRMFTGIPQGLISGAKQMMKNIPFMSAIPGMMQSGLNMGDSIARGVDNLERGFMEGGEQNDNTNRNAPMLRSSDPEPMKQSESSSDDKHTKPSKKTKKTKEKKDKPDH